MKNIWLSREELTAGDNYIYGDGYNANRMFIILQKYMFPIKGFIRAYTNGVKVLNGLPIVELKDLIEGQANILITQNKWMDIYDYLSDLIQSDRIYTMGNWENVENGKCIVCNSKKIIRGGWGVCSFFKGAYV